MSSPYTTIDGYLKNFSNETREILEKIRKMISKLAPSATETISYGIPTFKQNGKYLIYFAGYKEHISLYPATDEMINEIKGLAKYRVSKGTLKFKLNEAIPYALIEKAIKFKIKNFAHYGQSKKGSNANGLPKTSAPATSALNHIGIYKLVDLTKYTEKELLALHGMGPKAMGILKKELKKIGLSLRKI